jgi:hypothetical protein
MSIFQITLKYLAFWILDFGSLVLRLVTSPKKNKKKILLLYDAGEGGPVGTFWIFDLAFD